MSRLIRHALTSLALAALAASATAATISVGSFTPSTTPFVVPVDISGAIELASFQFDLFYDATQFSIYTSCDPFSGDAYCDFVTGPVTSGTFYSGSASFPPLFNPGFILLDAAGSQQIGQLLGVNGAWQDFGAAPSGDGVLAFIEFVALVDDPTSPITIGAGPSAVPEPSTVALLFAGLAMVSMRRSRRQARAPVALA